MRLELKEVRHDNSSVHLFSGLSFQLDQGEFLSFIGPSGCGKSTLLKICSGLLTPSQGSVSGDLLASAWVFQDSRLLPWLTVAENILLPLLVQDKPPLAPADLKTLLNTLGLSPQDADRFPHELSGGMKMRVAFARALAQEPSLLLLDEPFAALDEQTRFALQDLTLNHHRRSPAQASLFVTHSLAEALFLSDRILMLNKTGRWVSTWTRPRQWQEWPIDDLRSLREDPRFFSELTQLSRRFRELVFADGDLV